MTTKEKSVKLVRSVKIDQRTFERLKEHGKFADTIDDILNRLMDRKEKGV